jgi:hypothetical protein
MIGPMLKRADEVTEGLHPSEKAVLTRLCIDADERGGDTSRLSANDLCRLTGFSWRAVTLARAKLSRLGLILMCGENGRLPETIVDPKPIMPRAPTVGMGLSKCKLSTAKRRRIMERDAYRCRHCGDHRRLSIDHIVPRSAGGSNEDDNLQVLCVPCNMKKGARRP